MIYSKIEKRLNNIINNPEYKKLKETLIKFKSFEPELRPMSRSRNLKSTKSLMTSSSKNVLHNIKKYKRTRTFNTKDLVINADEDLYKDVIFKDEFSAIKVGDRVELYKNYIVPPKLDLKNICQTINSDNYFASTMPTNYKETLTDRDLYKQYMESHVNKTDKDNKSNINSILKGIKNIKLSSLLPESNFLNGKGKKNGVIFRSNNIGGTVKNVDINTNRSDSTLSKFYNDDKSKLIILPKIRSSNLLVKVFNN
jgi:hypothetical protein